MYKGLKPEKAEYADYPGAYLYKYPIAGETNSTVSAWSYDIKSHQTRKLQVPVDADGYMPRIISTNNGTDVAVYTMNRHQDCLRIYLVNPLSTVAKLLIEESVDKYVKEEALESIVFTDRHILMPSERDGYNHLYLYSYAGTRQRQVCPDKTVIDEVYGIDETTGDIFFSSTMNGATDRQICVAHANGRIDRLSKNNGWNMAVFSKNFRYYINNWSDLNTPPVYTLCDTKGKTLATLVDNSSLKANNRTAATNGLGNTFTFAYDKVDRMTTVAVILSPVETGGTASPTFSIHAGMCYTGVLTLT